MKRRKKNLLQTVLLAICITVISITPVRVRAEELPNEEVLYYDTEEGRFVNDIDEYLIQLNAGTITSFDSTITDCNESGVALFSLSEPSKKCSNIFGHKWGNWTPWEEIGRVHFPSGKCIVRMERWHYCTRTHCSASQSETDVVWVTCVH